MSFQSIIAKYAAKQSADTSKPHVFARSLINRPRSLSQTPSHLFTDASALLAARQ